MKNKIYFIAVFLLAAVCLWGQSKTYFISPNGNDNASGLSQKTAWKSLDKVNKTVFQPGDKILFESGGVWHGQLFLQGSGEEGNLIHLSSYGGKKKPIINFGKAEGAGIRLTNQSYWEISNMEVCSYAPAEIGIGRQGIVAIVKGDNQHMQHIRIHDCYIHDVWGQMGGSGEYVGYYSAAILVRSQIERNRDRTLPASTTFDDVLVENNRIERFDKCGIIIWGGKYDIVVRGNYMDNLGGDGIFVNGPYRGLIEYNEVRRSCMRSGYLDLPGGDDFWPHTAAIWIQNTEETIMQFNAVYDTGREPKNGDGNAYDFDFYCKRCTAQYNYSKNNHGFMLVMNNTFENVTRYNISENDKTHLVQIQCDLSDRNVFYNNVFYVDYGTADIDFHGSAEVEQRNRFGALFYNNIFYASGQARFRTVYSNGDVIGRNFDEDFKPDLAPGAMFNNNCYYGPWKNGLPDDPNKIVADPLFVDPGTGGNGLCTVEGYKLQPGSPCINAGLFVPLNSVRDYFGYPVNDGSVDIGAYEQLGSGVFADVAKEEALNRQEVRESRMAWAKWMFPKTIPVQESGEITIRLREPLEKEITGTLTWLDKQGKSKSITIQLDKAKQRNLFTFAPKADKDILLNSSVRISLKEKGGDLSEEWEIPLVEPAPRTR
ncbi:right-handed parallel beta-helix repeat-containing protein [Parabacteroides sp. OttesenSCG-928-O15]|nr:right-handed parallel beta-helix repeat-containing protein [Parabacteroides sp. OttesenSCG-928-O15]